MLDPSFPVVVLRAHVHFIMIFIMLTNAMLLHVHINPHTAQARMSSRKLYPQPYGTIHTLCVHKMTNYKVDKYHLARDKQTKHCVNSQKSLLSIMAPHAVTVCLHQLALYTYYNRSDVFPPLALHFSLVCL